MTLFLNCWLPVKVFLINGIQVDKALCAVYYIFNDIKNCVHVVLNVETYTPFRRKIKTTWVVLCRCQNSSEPSRHGLYKTSEGVKSENCKVGSP